MSKEEAIKYLQQLYPNGGHCWLDEQRIEAISMAIKALQEEPASEELEEAAMQYAKLKHKDAALQKIVSWDFKAGAKWQRSQLMRNAIEVVICDDTTICNAIEVMKLREMFKGQKVKIAVIKED